MAYRDPKDEQEYQKGYYRKNLDRLKKQKTERYIERYPFKMKENVWRAGRKVLIGEVLFEIKEIKKDVWSRTIVLARVKKDLTK
jgi:hypothetical protein